MTPREERPDSSGRDERWGVWGATYPRSAPIHSGRDERWGVWGAMSGPPS